MRLPFFVLLFYGISAESECFFPESELRPFFYEISSSTTPGTTVADSLVDPPGARIRLASIRSNNLPQVNFTEKFDLLSEETGRFRLVAAVPLSLPAYPSAVVETLLYVTVICNGRPFPLMTIRLSQSNTVAPSFLNEPYVVELDEAFLLGRETDTPISVVDWDPSSTYDVKLELENNTSFELASYPGGPPEGIEDVRVWTKAQYPPQFTLRRIGPITLPLDLKLKASDNGSPPRVALSSIRIKDKSKNPPVFSKCFISSKIRENSAKGTKVASIPIANHENARLALIDPDGTFAIERNELVVAEPKLVDRELFSTLEIVVENTNADKNDVCKRLRIRVELEDENDNRPVFERESYWFHLDEMAPAGTEFGILKARDVDQMENGMVTYELLNTTTPFRIYPRGRDAILATTASLGPEEQYKLVVEARDHGEPSKVTAVTIDVFVVRPGRPVKEINIKTQQKKFKGTIRLPSMTTTAEQETTSITTTQRPVTFSIPSRQEQINRAIDQATREFHELVAAPENPQNARKPSYSTTTLSPEEVRIRTVLRKNKDESREDPKLKKNTKEPVALRGVAQVTGRPRPHLFGLVPATSTTPRSNENEVEEEVDEEHEDLGGPDEKKPFGFTSNEYYYEVFGQPTEDDVFGRVVAEPNPQMYGLDRKVAGIFKVDSDIGELAVAKRLYLHSPGNISFSVSATDGQSTAQAVVTVLFEPDKPRTEAVPRFDRTLYRFRVEEGSSPEVIGIVRAFHTTASSRSSSASLKYSIDGAELPFSIHPASGEIANESPLDREEHSVYRFNARACLSNLPEVCGTATVEVLVGDTNDHAPRFSSSLVHVTLPSDVPIGTEVTRVRATDEDLNDNGAITYQLVPPSDIFAVDGETGRLVTVATLTDSKYTLLVEATDHGQPPQSDAMEVRIRVVGTNPSAPAFDQQRYHVVVAPPTPAGAVVAQVQATDPDPGPEGQVRYRFAKTEEPQEKKAQSLFEINEKTGVLSSVKALRGGEEPVDLVIEAYDGSSTFSRKASTLLHIEVGAETSLRFLPLPATIFISTEKALGSVILRASASTTSSSAVRFRVLEENSQFEMDGDLLRVVSHVFPGKTQLTLRAETDEVFVDHRLSIIAMETSDKYPVFPQLTFDIDIPKESIFPQVVAKFSARVRNGTVSYELHPETPPSLDLNSRTGELTIKTADFIPDGSDTTFIVVRARNAFFPDFFSDVGVALNRMDQRPQIRFGQAVYRLEVAENTPLGSLVSHPLDVLPKTVPVNFRLSPADSFFGINGNGTVFVQKPIDLEQVGTTVLQFTAWAETNRGDKTTARLHVDLKDENEFAPETLKAFVEGKVRKNSPPGTVVAKFDAEDKDFTEGKHLLFRIIGGTGKELVFVQEDGTLILGDKPIGKEHMPTFDVQVEVYDKNGNKASAMALITVESANNQTPVIQGLPLRWTVTENEAPSFPITATDEDGGNITFQIIQGNSLEYFKVESNGKDKALLKIVKPLDFEEQTAYHLTLEARDGGSPPKVTVFPVEVKVDNTNDNPPVFTQKSLSQRVSADVPIGLPLLSTAATDSDGDNVTYSITGPDCSSLSLDPLGVLSWSVPPAQRPLKKIVCQVTASDGVYVSSASLNLEVFSEKQATTANRAPIFNQKEYTFTAEGPVGTRIGQVSAADPDGDQVLFAIKPAEYRNLFDVDHQGYVTLKQDAHELSQSHYLFLISAEDWGPPIMTTVVNVHVRVLQADNQEVSESTDQAVINVTEEAVLGGRMTSERPKDVPVVDGEHLGPIQGVQPIIKFLRPSYVYSIKGDSPKGTYLGQVHVTFNKGVTFDIVGDDLTVDEEGRLRTNKLLKEGKLNDTIIAFKQGQTVAEVPVIVHVIDVSPSPAALSPSPPSSPSTASTSTASSTAVTRIDTRRPLSFSFERPLYFAFVPEGKHNTGLKVPIKPEPLTTNTDGTVSFSLLNKTEVLPFHLTKDGQLVAFDVDREQKQFYMVDVLAKHEGEEARTRLNVTILDVNDNYPQFEDSADTIGLASDAQIGSVVYAFKASDLDSGSNGRVTFGTEGDSSHLFAIDRDAGILSVVSALSPSQLTLTVVASDQGRPSLKSKLPLTIHIFDAHSPAPLLPKLSKNMIVPQGAEPGYLIATLLAGPTVSSLSTLEPIEYGLADDYYGLFKIDDEGHLLLSRPAFPTETGHLHQVNVTAKNSLGEDYTLVNVLFEPYNEASISAQEQTTSPSDSTACRFTKNVYQVEVLENQPAEQHIATVTAECQNPSYTLSEDYEDFSLDSYGRLFTKRPLDREAKSLYLVYVGVNHSRIARSDPIVESAKQHLQPNQAVIIVRVLDENDNSPYFEQLVNGRLVAHVDWKARPHSPVLRISAKDKDQSPHLIYSIPDSEQFIIDPATGVISLKSSLEEGKNVFEIPISVDDGAHQATVPLVIYKLSPDTNVVRLTSELPPARVKEFQVERTLNELTGTDSRVMAKGPVEGERSAIYIYAVDPESKEPLTKEKLVLLLSAQQAALMTSPSRISSVSISPPVQRILSVSQILLLLLFILLVILLLLLTCWCARYCRRKRYTTSTSDREYMFSAGGGPRPYDVEVITRQTAQTVLAQVAIPSPMATHRESAVSPAFADRSESVKDFGNSVRERPGLLQSALSRHKIQPGRGSLSAVVVQKDT